MSNFLQMKQGKNTCKFLCILQAALCVVYGKSRSISSTSQRLQTGPISDFFHQMKDDNIIHVNEAKNCSQA